jgi:hypothetical protein
MEIPLKGMLSKAARSGSFRSGRGNAETDPAYQQIGGNFLRGQFHEVDRKGEGARPEDKTVGLERDMPEKQMRSGTHSIEVWKRRPAGGERVVMAVDDDDGADAEHGIHGEGLRLSDAHANEPLPAAATHRAPCGEAGEPPGGKLNGVQYHP